MSKLAIVLLSDMKDPVKVEMALRFALAAKKDGTLADLRFFFFGPGVQVPKQLQEQPDLKAVLDDLLASGIATVACIFNARQLQQEQHLRDAEIQMAAIGGELVGLVNNGYQMMTF